MRKIADHAVVLGAGMAGLLAARVLADAYQRVTVVERDPLPETAENRKGVPQGRHAHLLWPRGTQSLDELFPGMLDDLVAHRSPANLRRRYERLLTAAEHDPAVAERFLRVAALQDPATRLFRLPTARRVLLGSLRRRHESAIDATTRVAISGPRT